jgi:hypothetical protein
VRADAPILERELFKLFERQAIWTFSRLQEETAQPGPHLKEVLSGVSCVRRAASRCVQLSVPESCLRPVLQIAVQVKGGVQKGQWTLKKDYQFGEGAGEGAGPS